MLRKDFQANQTSLKQKFGTDNQQLDANLYTTGRKILNISVSAPETGFAFGNVICRVF